MKEIKVQIIKRFWICSPMMYLKRRNYKKIFFLVYTMEVFCSSRLSGQGHILRLTASHPNLREVKRLICEAARNLRAVEGLGSNDGYESPLDYSGRVGRPRFEVSRAQLEYLLQNGFSGTQIAQMLAISLSTVRRRMREFSLLVKALYSTFSEGELDNWFDMYTKGYFSMISWLIHEIFTNMI